MSAMFDVIADIHGQGGLLVSLLARLGYQPAGSSRKHPEGRKIIFLGDFINRGPAIRQTLHLVRAMVEAGDALAIMGNHEFDALARYAPGGEHDPSLVSCKSTEAVFRAQPKEWAEFLGWFETLPLWIDLGGLRIVHACWDGAAISDLGGNPAFRASMLTRGGKERASAELLLKGPSIALPQKSETVSPASGRIRWWIRPKAWTYGEILAILPPGLPGDTPVAQELCPHFCGYPPDSPPLIFGHYGFPKPSEPVLPNAACLDQGAGRGGPLAAYRWEGEPSLSASRFVVAMQKSPAPNVAPR